MEQQYWQRPSQQAHGVVILVKKILIFLPTIYLPAHHWKKIMNCREGTSRSRLRNVSNALFIAGATADTNDLEISALSSSLISSSLNSI
jgi:hypothetical protein